MHWHTNHRCHVDHPAVFRVDAYLPTPWPDTPIVASCNLLVIAPTPLPFPSSCDDTGRVRNRYRLHSSRICKPSIGTVPFDSSTRPNSSRKPCIYILTKPPLPSPPQKKNRKNENLADGWKGEAQAFGWVDHPGDYLSLLTFPPRTSTSLRSAWSC